MKTFNSYLYLHIDKKNLSMTFIIGLLISKNLKRNSNNFILVIVNKLTKIISYKSVKTIINIAKIAKIIINMYVRYFCLPNYIISNRCALFISKFRSSLCYFLGIK